MKIASDVLEKASLSTSGRFLPCCSTTDGTGLLTTFTAYGSELKLHRRLMQSYMNTEIAKGHIKEVQNIEARRLLLRLLQQPERFLQHARTFPGAVILKITYGYEVSSEGYDAFVHLAELALEEAMFKASIPGKWIVDFLPFLKYLPEWLPGMSFKETGRKWRKIVQDFFDKPYLFVKRQMSDKQHTPSYTSYYIERGMHCNANEEDALKRSAGSLFAGGADTSAAVLKTFFRAMALYPEVVRRAQEELDRVVGTERLPSFQDRERLPYINALIREIFRWETVAPTGIPHVVTKELLYNGFRIPKDAVILPNAWGMGHDPENYANPSMFELERFLKENPDPDPYSFAFGYGRRACPGKAMADSSLFISISMMLATFDITKAKDEKGNDIEPDTIYSPGFVSHPTPFRCSINPRSDKAIEFIRSVLVEYPFEKGHSDILDSIY